MSKEAEICDVISTDNTLWRRIMGTYFRKHGKDAAYPHANIPIVEYENKYYAVLYNGVNDILDVYRIIEDTPYNFTLKSINVQWFKEITKKIWE